MSVGLTSAHLVTKPTLLMISYQKISLCLYFGCNSRQPCTVTAASILRCLVKTFKILKCIRFLAFMKLLRII